MLSADLRSYLNLEPLPLVVVDSNRRIVFANRASQSEWSAVDDRALDDLLPIPESDWLLLRRALEIAADSPESALVAVTMEHVGGATIAMEAGQFVGLMGESLMLLRARDRRMNGIVSDPVIGVLRAQASRARELQDEIKRLSARNRQLTTELGQDELTGVASRRALFRSLASDLRTTRRGSAGLGLLMVDVDYFKRFNDSCGHLAGDQCLIAVAEALGSTGRRTHDLLARFGGEEFAVVLPGIDAAALEERAAAVCAAVVSRQIPHPDSPVGPHVTVSVGAAWIPPGGSVRAREALERADRALYAAKVAGRNRIELAAVNGSARRR
ncbi:diguanylate cyclase [Engelhardtia mirabilis]|uniref:diguanylate cyclase n=1 Tax=Engelhardtia mirabilis TaxID=2528011 RepID=UPI003AF3D033